MLDQTGVPGGISTPGILATGAFGELVPAAQEVDLAACGQGSEKLGISERHKKTLPVTENPKEYFPKSKAL